MSALVWVIIVLLLAFGISVVLIRRHYMKLLDSALKRAQKSERLKSVFIDNISRTLHAPLKVIDACVIWLSRRKMKTCSLLR